MILPLVPAPSSSLPLSVAIALTCFPGPPIASAPPPTNPQGSLGFEERRRCPGPLFDGARYPTAATFSTTVRAADFDGDGRVDLLVADDYGPLSVLRNRGDATFGDPVESDTSFGLREAVAADLDGDGDLDVAGVSGSRWVSVHVNDGRGSFSTTPYEVPGSYAAVVATDLDGDGDRDLAVVGNGIVSILPNRYESGRGMYGAAAKRQGGLDAYGLLGVG